MRRIKGKAVDMGVTVGSVKLSSPVMSASGTAGHGAELADYFDLNKAGAIVVKSLSHDRWEGNPAPRLAPVAAGMINSVGLAGPGVSGWIENYLGALISTGATIVASIWGRSVKDYELAASALAPVSEHLCALELNVSCPNLEDSHEMFAHSPEATAAVVAASLCAGLPLWVKLSPNVADLVPVAQAAMGAGASALTIANTLIGLSIDTKTAKPALGAGKGGVSGPAIRPICVRAVHDVASAMPQVPIIGCGGIACGNDALEFMIAGACAVQVGTASFADPRAVLRIADEMKRWCVSNDVSHVASLTASMGTHSESKEGNK